MFDGRFFSVRGIVPNPVARGCGCNGTSSPNPSHRQKLIGLHRDFFGGLEANRQAGFQLRNEFRKRLEFTGSFVVHVRHEDA